MGKMVNLDIFTSLLLSTTPAVGGALEGAVVVVVSTFRAGLGGAEVVGCSELVSVMEVVDFLVVSLEGDDEEVGSGGKCTTGTFVESSSNCLTMSFWKN